MTCRHPHPECLNHYEIIRKYKCSDCGGVYICSCERDFSSRFLPHQVRFGRPIETQGHVPLDAFADNMCTECRGLHEEPHPKAAIYGVKGKVERYYWREIFKTYCRLLSEHFGEELPPEAVVNNKLSPVTRELRRKALAHWQQMHKTAPKYDTREGTEAAFLKEVSVPVRELMGTMFKLSASANKSGSGGVPMGRWFRGLGWSPEAIEDIETIASYIERDSPWYAKAVASKIVEAAETIPAV